MMKPSDFPWKLKQSEALNGYTFRIESADGYTIGEFYGSTNPMWDSVPGARQAQENAMLVIDASCRIAELEQQLAEKDAEIERLKSEERSHNMEYGDVHDSYTKASLELAASQAREQQLRDALSDVMWAATERDKKNRIRQFDEYINTGCDLLAIHTDTSALESMIAKAGEVMRHRAIEASGNIYSMDEIRTLHGVTLKDLKD